MRIVFFWFFALFYCLFAPVYAAENIAFPADAGFINVRDFGAKGDGTSDDTAAINAALAASGEDTKTLFWQDKIVYFPNGTYIVSAPISKRYAEGRYASGAIMVGESREKTIIKLKDNADGYAYAAAPRAVIFTTAKLLDGSPTSGGKDYTNKGEGNDAYANFVENMTIDVGIGNAGAVGIDYLANNLGAIRAVTVKAGAGSGAIGINMKRKWIGPALLSDVEVVGFDTGIAVDNSEYGVTLDNVRLKNQKKFGLSNNQNIISAHGLVIDGAPQKIVNKSPDGMIIQADDRQKWKLPIKSAPLAPNDAPKKWAAVRVKNMENPDADAASAIREAFNSGASTIYFPHGIYYVGENIIVPPSVRRIVGMTSTIRPLKPRPATLRRDFGLLRATGGGEPLTIEHLAFDNSYLGDQFGFELSGKRTAVLRDVVGAGAGIKRSATGGELFLENISVAGGLTDISGDSGVWARQLDTEGGGGSTRIVNNGAPFWVLGIKTEGNCTVLNNKNGANSEIIGGLIYMVRPADNKRPAFINENAKLKASYAEEAFDKKAAYETHLLEIKGDNEREVSADMLPARAAGRKVEELVSE